jgi:lipopolysaccharide export system permease protein
MTFKFKGLQRLDWYIIRKFLVTFFVSILFLAVLIIIFDISEKIEDFIKREAPLHEIVFDYYLNWVPYFINQYAPMFVFLTVIFFTSKMTQDSEVVAILSGGISYHRFALPFILSALFIAVMSLELGQWVLPHANGVRVEFEQKYNPWRKVKIGHDMHYKLEDDRFVYLESFSAYNNTAYSFTLEDLSGGRLHSKISAESAQYDTVTGVWHLRNWIIREYDEGMRDHIRSGRQMDTTLSLTRDDFFMNKFTIQRLNKRELNQLIEAQKMRGDASVNMALIEKNNRLSLPFSTVILTIIGLALCTKKKRGGMGWNLAAGTALAFSYILFMQFSEMFVITDTLPASIAIWMPNFLYTIIAIVLYVKAPK